MNMNIPHQPIIANNTHESTVFPEEESFFDLMMLFKIIFYLLFAIKIMELSFLRRKKYSLKERIYRKFLFAHQELLRHFTDEDKSMMETTLTNTMKNACV
jgi:hypothetical protein